MLTKSALQQMKKEDLIGHLEDNYQIRAESSSNKIKLIEMILDNQAASLDVALEEEEDEILIPETDDLFDGLEDEEEEAPSINQGDPEWTEFIISKLTEDEMVEGHPSCDGLRRIFRVLVSNNFDVNIEPLQFPSKENDGRATVKCTIEFFDSSVNRVRKVSDASDCYWGNSKKPYCNHAIATAATMAEGRCYRKILGLRTQTLEESLGQDEERAFMNKQIEEIQPANTNQISIIAKLSRQLGINPERLAMQFDTELKDLTAKQAISILGDIKAYRDKSKDIPKELFDESTEESNRETNDEGQRSEDASETE